MVRRLITVGVGVIYVDMIFENSAELIDRINELTGRNLRKTPKIFEDTSSYMNIVGGSVVRIGGNDYYIITDAKENRFGVDDQPKFWVKYAFDLETGQRKILKLVFHEEFTAHIGIIRIRCRRSPSKESAILELVQGNTRFMQGITVKDTADNLVRIIDVISGRSLYHYLAELESPHEAYFYDILPGIMTEVIPCIEALAELHRQGQHHGDVRSDHLWIEHGTSRYKWIDFDYGVSHTDHDVWSTGNLLIRVVGKGTHRLRDLNAEPDAYGCSPEAISDLDRALLLKDRIANLGKLYPYIPPALNEILLRFSAGATDFYSDLDQMVIDLREVFGLSSSS